MTYSFGRTGLSRGRVALYAVVLLIFVVAVTSIASNQSSKPDGSSGYLLSKKEATDLKEVPASGKLLTTGSLNNIDNVQKQLDKLKSDLGLFSSNLTSCYENTANVSNQYQGCSKDLTSCNADYLKLTTNNSAVEQRCDADKTSLRLTISALTTSNTDLNRTLSSLTTDYDSIKKQFNDLASNSANNICCKARVDNSKIRFFKIESSKIVCSEDSGTSINCQ